ncbi:MAG TPA: VWA domain-containing protein [Vicinamibacterales bacterium]|nr:VWA domain-containing protein [Vicinamibacterales bacterium]
MPRLLAQARERIAYVSVFDKDKQQPVRDLPAEAFVIREDGTRREVLRVATADSPLPIAIIVDNSQAAAPAINDLRKGLTAFLTAVQGSGPISIVTIADRPTALTDYTSSHQELLDAANRLFHGPSSGATLLDAIAEVAKGLAKRDADRAAIVVITTENIEYSNLQYPDVLAALKASGATLHVLVLVNQRGSFSTDEARNRSTVLDRGPRESGGVRMDVLSSMSFEPRLRDLAAIIKSQYRVVYSRPQSLIPPEKFEVSVAKPGLEAHGAPARGQAVK